MTILAMREKTLFGRERTLTRVIRTEDSNEAWEFARKHVRKGSTIHADEHFSYDDLQGLQELRRVNHSKEYETEDGVNTNHVESFFSRIQRAYVGIHSVASAQAVNGGYPPGTTGNPMPYGMTPGMICCFAAP